ncbi:Peroxide stress-activated histidine kinase mak2 [Seminavis robusta]|uniref:Peroxide stress-activated histidine kinase mak2 n=1 Tax=Seminavis robusta TaxID=568900 RepID=A0A9N8DRA8_9STRA|nr:Peroxide stress-activated histidine kinase mak2 [Seminavis robusta]|eukprot:Sro296_g110670.1 Peroxide stress-activated histidine kinase mak2 (682) ;mRNA; f:34449-36575
MDESTEITKDTSEQLAAGSNNSGSKDHEHCCHRRDDLAALNILKHPVWIFDVERKCMFWANKAALEIWKADSLTELLERDFASDMSEETNTRMLDHLEQMKRGKVMTEQWTYYPKGGRPKTLQVSGSVIWIQHNNDIDNDSRGRAAVLAEAELPDHAGFHDSTAREVELLRHVPMAVCQFKMNGDSIFRNPEDLRVFGVDKGHDDDDDNNEKKSKTGLLDRFVDPSVATTMLEKLQDGKDYRVAAKHYVADDGPPLWFAISCRKSKDPVTSDDSILYSARDITEVMKAREDTKKANLKSEFMSVIAHEIRTPLHQIVGYTDLLELTNLAEKQVEAVRMIQRSLDNLMSILNDLLDYNKYECGHTELEKIHFSLRGLLRGCVTSIQTEAVAKGIDLRLDLVENLPFKVIGDPNKLRQILLNLLQNAVKFTDQGHVILSASTRSSINTPDNHHQVIRFEVTDTGIGIPRTHQTMIFEKYAKVNLNNAINYNGTGLGLAICASLAQAMGGKIGVDSEMGKGSTFYMEIPLELSTTEEASAVKKDQMAAEELSPDESLRVLVVEDNKVNQKLVVRMLGKLGHSSVVAENGQVALDKLQSAQADLVLMDIQMPVMDGLEATREIRKTRTKFALPIVGLSASFQNADLETYLDIGMNQCLSKPVRLETLKRTIDKTIANCRMGRGSV